MAVIREFYKRALMYRKTYPTLEAAKADAEEQDQWELTTRIKTDEYKKDKDDAKSS